ncbi:hypothetical protein JRO89_XS01G0132700 [Xanthoceras sorbifolium]|uniref:EamA domain-containing protein n=1 Tax=Xanthoceras sorbifolium TaxID=99658 RepID=A0ABQ8IJ44_9ROSI|nr:hypothetical protein JRO89_XS01G0132700 [Xanthoceras sorbifolium]
MSSSSAETTDAEQPVELIVCDASSPEADVGVGITPSDEIAPLLTQSDKPKIDIFSVSYSRRKPRERVMETEISPLSRFILWVWNGSRYSGLLCMAFSAMIYFLMEVIADVFTDVKVFLVSDQKLAMPVQSIPLFETTFTRCTVILILSYLWLRRSGQPIFGPAHARNILISRALMGYLSLFSFIYCIQRVRLSQAIVLSFTTPIMASIAAKFILHEKLKISDIGGVAAFFVLLAVSLVCSSFLDRYLLHKVENFMYASFAVSEGLVKAGEASIFNVRGSHHIFAVLVGLFSSITGGISYCLIKAGAKASDQPVVTLFSFGILASPAAGLCTFSFEGHLLPQKEYTQESDSASVECTQPYMYGNRIITYIISHEFQLPSLYSFFLMLVLGVLAFFAQVLLARALQLEKTSRVANVQYIEAALTLVWGVSSARIVPSFGRFFGCLLILLSVCYTMCIGPDKETNEIAYSSVV